MRNTTISVEPEVLERLRAIAPNGNLRGFLRDLANDPKLAAQRMTSESVAINVLSKQIDGLRDELVSLYSQMMRAVDRLDAFDTVLGPEVYHEVNKYLRMKDRNLKEMSARQSRIEEEHPEEYAKYETVKDDWIKDGERQMEESRKVAGDTAAGFLSQEEAATLILPGFNQWLKMGCPDYAELKAAMLKQGLVNPLDMIFPSTGKRYPRMRGKDKG